MKLKTRVKINLLPLEQKESLEKKHWLYFIMRVSATALAALAVFAVFLISCLIIINYQKEAAANDIANASQRKIYQDIAKANAVWEKYYSQTKKINKELNSQRSFWELLIKINQAIPEGVFLNELKINDNHLGLKGFAYERKQLLEFKDILEKMEELSKIDAPIGNFTSSHDIYFEFDATIKNENEKKP